MRHTDELITAAEAALIAGVHVATIKRAAKHGQLKPRKKLPGRTGAYLFRLKDVHAYKDTRAA